MKVAEELERNSLLRSLGLRGNEWESEGVMRLAEALEQNPTLTHLSLSESRSLSADAVVRFSQMLQSNSSLTALNFSENWLRIDKAKPLFEALKYNTTLTSLDLGGNNLKNEGAVLLADALEQNSSLTTLLLNRNRIFVHGAERLAAALKRNSTLINLHLEGGNYITDEGHRLLAEAIERNKVIALVTTSKSEGGHGRGEKRLKQALEINNMNQRFSRCHFIRTLLYLSRSSYWTLLPFELRELILVNLCRSWPPTGRSATRMVRFGKFLLSHAKEVNEFLLKPMHPQYAFCVLEDWKCFFTFGAPSSPLKDKEKNI